MTQQNINIEEQHTDDSKLIGFDYQVLYFLLLSLGLQHGESIGFEVKDDIHIKKANGDVELLQLKHSVQKKSDDTIVNLTERDEDIWKTINNWIQFININGSYLEINENKENFNQSSEDLGKRFSKIAAIIPSYITLIQTFSTQQLYSSLKIQL